MMDNITIVMMDNKHKLFECETSERRSTNIEPKYQTTLNILKMRLPRIRIKYWLAAEV